MEGEGGHLLFTARLNKETDFRDQSSCLAGWEGALAIVRLHPSANLAGGAYESGEANRKIVSIIGGPKKVMICTMLVEHQ